MPEAAPRYFHPQESYLPILGFPRKIPAGLAGPDGDGIHDVGTVCVGLATPTETITAELHIPGKNRENVRMSATQWALDMVRRYLTDIPIEKKTNV